MLHLLVAICGKHFYTFGKPHNYSLICFNKQFWRWFVWQIIKQFRSDQHVHLSYVENTLVLTLYPVSVISVLQSSSTSMCSVCLPGWQNHKVKHTHSSPVRDSPTRGGGRQRKQERSLACGAVTFSTQGYRCALVISCRGRAVHAFSTLRIVTLYYYYYNRTHRVDSMTRFVGLSITLSHTVH